MEPVFVVPPPAGGDFRRRSGICLNMIVKNESAVLERLLGSVREAIDYFVIVDTGSTDGTPDLIRRLAIAWGLSGEVHSRPWVHFGHNRQEALALAVAAGRGDWLLFIDADEELECADPDWFKTLQPGVSYRLRKRLGKMRYALDNLVDIRDSRWSWRGPVHEYLACEQGGARRETRDDVWIHCHAGEGARSLGLTAREKFLADAALLETALQASPDDARNRFYLAQSYRDAGELSKAFEHYAARVRLGGWAEEAYVAQCEMGQLAIALKRPHEEVVRLLLQAWHMRPTRAEALWYLARHCRETRRFAEGFLFANTGKDIAEPGDLLFVQREVYAWRLWDELAVNAYWIGRYQASADACRHLLATQRHPASHTPRMQANLDFALAQLAKQGHNRPAALQGSGSGTLDFNRDKPMEKCP